MKNTLLYQKISEETAQKRIELRGGRSIKVPTLIKAEKKSVYIPPNLEHGNHVLFHIDSFDELVQTFYGTNALFTKCRSEFI